MARCGIGMPVDPGASHSSAHWPHARDQGHTAEAESSCTSASFARRLWNWLDMSNTDLESGPISKLQRRRGRQGSMRAGDHTRYRFACTHGAPTPLCPTSTKMEDVEPCRSPESWNLQDARDNSRYCSYLGISFRPSKLGGTALGGRRSTRGSVQQDACPRRRQSIRARRAVSGDQSGRRSICAEPDSQSQQASKPANMNDGIYGGMGRHGPAWDGMERQLDGHFSRRSICQGRRLLFMGSRAAADEGRWSMVDGRWWTADDRRPMTWPADEDELLGPF